MRTTSPPTTPPTALPEHRSFVGWHYTHSVPVECAALEDRDWTLLGATALLSRGSVELLIPYRPLQSFV